MIQRIQTVYLILVVILMGLTFILPSSQGFIESSSANYIDIFKVMPFSVESAALETTEPLSLFTPTTMGVSICFVIGWALLIITRFKNRWLQIRLTVFLMIFLVFVEGFMVYNGYKLTSELDKYSDIKNSFPMWWGSIMPVISFILAYLAFRGILKDEILIKSLNSNRMR